jgi:phosphoenolpyruvate carboxylase
LRRSIQSFTVWWNAELDSVLFYITEVLYRVVPPYLESLTLALKRHYGEEIALLESHPVLQFGSWVGADMDGNPNVNADTIRSTLSAQRAAIIRCYLPEVRRLGRYLSQTLGEVEISTEVITRLGWYASEHPKLYGEISKRHLDMPYRCLLQIAAARLKATAENASNAYESSVDFIEDLGRIAASLEENKGTNAGLFGVRRLLMRARAFGFHLATLDARQDSLVHREVMAELLGNKDWLSMPLAERSGQLGSLLVEGGLARFKNQTGLSDQVRSTLEVFKVLAESSETYGPAATGVFIISMTQGADDVLTALALARIADPLGRDQIPMDIAPLLETVDDLAAGEEILSSLLKDKAYTTHLRHRGNRQIIMVGYSDSNKDSGIVSARWALQQAQTRLLELGKQHGVKVLFFHGRGGTVSRGGGNLVNGITGAPAESVGGYLRVTEQGEVINQKYGIRPLALRNLELVSGATLQHGLCDVGQNPSPEMIKLLSGMAITGRSKYRGLIYDDPDFVGFFRTATPIDVIERLQIGSRPASRRSGAGIENLRAIPWVFSWAQTRIGLPGVYGMGTALESALHSVGLEFLQHMYSGWSFFRGMVNDVEMVLGKSDMEIGESYFRLAGQDFTNVRASIFAEFDLATRLILEIKQQDSLLDDQRNLKRNIRLRNPYVDPLHILQIKLLKQWREGGREDPELLATLKATVNGIALGIQNTG